MFKKQKLKREIKKCIKEIDMLEQKRTRSQAALVTAILQHTTPDDADVDYFNTYTAKIDDVRARMSELKAQLAALEK